LEFVMHSPSSYFARTLVAAAFLSVTASWADSYKGPTPPAVYTQECGSCHLAFPPNLLPKASWQRVMNSLDKHYGSDASLDAATQKQIDTWLQTYGGQGKRAREEPPLDRITRSAWFERKHRELSAATFKRASIKSPANCTACHRDAVQGDFEENRVRIPK
jgi:nitrate/TMAO reductase-like tetraheme cytochrome c subunit